ncbi:MAG: trypsin-like peptidase domain-containing protein [Planctomycetes bacterium]|nr:trypsin-like peptidase domain-containing protein [Planctomycetota bacterium]
MRAQLLHLSGPLRGRTVTHSDPRLTIGSDPACDVSLSHAQVLQKHAEIEWVEGECQFHLRRRDGAVFVNGDEVDEVILQEDDLVEIGENGPRIRFRIWWPPGASCKVVRRMLQDAREVAKESGAVAGTKALTRDLLTQATPTLKIGFPILVLALALPIGWLAGWLGGRPSLEQATTAAAVARAEIEALRQEHEKHRAEIALLRRGSETVRRIQDHWIRGVCLIHGMLKVQMPDGTELEDRDGTPLRPEYTGTGFLASAAGWVVTNRHVVTPWEEMKPLQPLLDIGAKVSFFRITATFPGLQPIEVDPATIRRRSDKLDVAVFLIPPPLLPDVPVLPLHRGPLDDPERRAIVVGYPAGLVGLLAKADSALADQLRAEDAPMTTVIERLAGQSMVAPMVTQGLLGNSNPTVLVYDAETTHGGSGGPVFAADGTVIGVNYAILPDFSAANYGVPIQFALELLPD